MTYKYASIRYAVDPSRDMTVPAGIVLWNQANRSMRFRFLEDKEHVHQLTASVAGPALRATRRQLETWARTGELPYGEQLDPLSDEWWAYLRERLYHVIQLGEPQSVDVCDEDAEIEALYEAVVKPVAPRSARRKRMDGVVRRALGELAGMFHRGSVQGFGGRAVPVMRLLRDAGGKAVIVEAINFAGATAEADADALASKLRRIQAVSTVNAVVGYIASPGGLNDEAALKEWVEHESSFRLMDLDRQTDEFRDMVRVAVRNVALRDQAG